MEVNEKKIARFLILSIFYCISPRLVLFATGIFGFVFSFRENTIVTEEPSPAESLAPDHSRVYIPFEAPFLAPSSTPSIPPVAETPDDSESGASSAAPSPPPIDTPNEALSLTCSPPIDAGFESPPVPPSSPPINTPVRAPSSAPSPSPAPAPSPPPIDTASANPFSPPTLPDIDAWDENPSPLQSPSPTFETPVEAPSRAPSQPPPMDTPIQAPSPPPSRPVDTPATTPFSVRSPAPSILYVTPRDKNSPLTSLPTPSLPSVFLREDSQSSAHPIGNASGGLGFSMSSPATQRSVKEKSKSKRSEKAAPNIGAWHDTPSSLPVDTPREATYAASRAAPFGFAVTAPATAPSSIWSPAPSRPCVDVPFEASHLATANAASASRSVMSQNRHQQTMIKKKPTWELKLKESKNAVALPPQSHASQEHAVTQLMTSMEVRRLITVVGSGWRKKRPGLLKRIWNRITGQGYKNVETFEGVVMKNVFVEVKRRVLGSSRSRGGWVASKQGPKEQRDDVGMKGRRKRGLTEGQSGGPKGKGDDGSGGRPDGGPKEETDYRSTEEGPKSRAEDTKMKRNSTRSKRKNATTTLGKFRMTGRRGKEAERRLRRGRDVAQFMSGALSMASSPPTDQARGLERNLSSPGARSKRGPPTDQAWGLSNSGSSSNSAAPGTRDGGANEQGGGLGANASNEFTSPVELNNDAVLTSARVDDIDARVQKLEDDCFARKTNLFEVATNVKRLQDFEDARIAKELERKRTVNEKVEEDGLVDIAEQKKNGRLNSERFQKIERDRIASIATKKQNDRDAAEVKEPEERELAVRMAAKELCLTQEKEARKAAEAQEQERIQEAEVEKRRCASWMAHDKEKIHVLKEKDELTARQDRELESKQQQAQAAKVAEEPRFKREFEVRELKLKQGMEEAARFQVTRDAEALNLKQESEAKAAREAQELKLKKEGEEAARVQAAKETRALRLKQRVEARNEVLEEQKRKDKSAAAELKMEQEAEAAAGRTESERLKKIEEDCIAAERESTRFVDEKARREEFERLAAVEAKMKQEERRAADAVAQRIAEVKAMAQERHESTESPKASAFRASLRNDRTQAEIVGSVTCSEPSNGRTAAFINQEYSDSKPAVPPSGSAFASGTHHASTSFPASGVPAPPETENSKDGGRPERPTKTANDLRVEEKRLPNQIPGGWPVSSASEVSLARSSGRTDSTIMSKEEDNRAKMAAGSSATSRGSFDHSKPIALTAETLSPFQKASRVADEGITDGYVPLTKRRAVSFQPFGVARSREVPVYERSGVARSTDKEEYERFKSKQKETGDDKGKEDPERKLALPERKPITENKPVSRYTSSFMRRKPALSNLVNDSSSGTSGIARSIDVTDKSAKVFENRKLAVGQDRIASEREARRVVDEHARLQREESARAESHRYAALESKRKEVENLDPIANKEEDDRLAREAESKHQEERTIRLEGREPEAHRLAEVRLREKRTLAKQNRKDELEKQQQEAQAAKDAEELRMKQKNEARELEVKKEKKQRVFKLKQEREEAARLQAAKDAGELRLKKESEASELELKKLQARAAKDAEALCLKQEYKARELKLKQEREEATRIQAAKGAEAAAALAKSERLKKIEDDRIASECESKPVADKKELDRQAAFESKRNAKERLAAITKKEKEDGKAQELRLKHAEEARVEEERLRRIEEEHAAETKRLQDIEDARSELEARRLTNDKARLQREKQAMEKSNSLHAIHAQKQKEESERLARDANSQHQEEERINRMRREKEDKHLTGKKVQKEPKLADSTAGQGNLQTYIGGPISSAKWTTHESKQGCQRELSEGIVEVKSGGNLMRESVLHHDYQEEHTRGKRSDKKKYMASTEQESKQVKGRESRETKHKPERKEGNEEKKKSEFECRESDVRVSYEDKPTRMNNVPKEKHAANKGKIESKERQYSPQTIGRAQSTPMQSPGKVDFSSPPKPRIGQYAPGLQQSQLQEQPVMSAQRTETPCDQPCFADGYKPKARDYNQRQQVCPALPSFSAQPQHQSQSYSSKQSYPSSKYEDNHAQIKRSEGAERGAKMEQEVARAREQEARTLERAVGESIVPKSSRTESREAQLLKKYELETEDRDARIKADNLYANQSTTNDNHIGYDQRYDLGNNNEPDTPPAANNTYTGYSQLQCGSTGNNSTAGQPLRSIIYTDYSQQHYGSSHGKTYAAQPKSRIHPQVAVLSSFTLVTSNTNRRDASPNLGPKRSEKKKKGTSTKPAQDSAHISGTSSPTHRSYMIESEKDRKPSSSTSRAQISVSSKNSVTSLEPAKKKGKADKEEKIQTKEQSRRKGDTDSREDKSQRTYGAEKSPKVHVELLEEDQPEEWTEPQSNQWTAQIAVGSDDRPCYYGNGGGWNDDNERVVHQSMGIDTKQEPPRTAHNLQATSSFQQSPHAFATPSSSTPSAYASIKGAVFLSKPTRDEAKAGRQESRHFTEHSRKKGSTGSKKDKLVRAHKAEKTHREQPEREQLADRMKQEPTQWTAQGGVGSHGRYYHQERGEYSEDDDDYSTYQNMGTDIKHKPPVMGQTFPTTSSYLKTPYTSAAASSLMPSAYAQPGMPATVVYSNEDPYTSAGASYSTYATSTPGEAFSTTSPSRQAYLEQQDYRSPAQTGLGSSAWSDKQNQRLGRDRRTSDFKDDVAGGSESGTERHKGSLSSQNRADSYSPTEAQQVTFKGYQSPEAILRGTAMSREQPVYAREQDRQRLAMLQSGIASSGMTESRGSRFGEADESGSTQSRKTAPRREHDGKTTRDRRDQRIDPNANGRESKQSTQHTHSSQPQQTYSIGKEHLGDNNDGFRSRSTIGTTSAEKMQMKGSNEATAMYGENDGYTEDEDDDDYEAKYEGLVGTRGQVPESMRRAMEKNEEWRGFS